MWNPLKEWLAHRERMATIQLDAQNAPYLAMVTVVEAQNKVLNEWLSGFKSTAIPATTTVREHDEYLKELERDRSERVDSWERLETSFPNI